MAEPYDEGYPSSSLADLDPGPDLSESLDEADREAGGEQRFVPEGRRADDSVEDEDRGDDAHDADALDDAESRHHLSGGRGPQDLPNFNDNTAVWSRSRSTAPAATAMRPRPES